MFWVICAVSAVLASEPPSGISAEDWKTYEASAATAGRDAAAHVRLALWCEARGLKPERDRQLATAVMIDPKDETARGLLGQVYDGERWRQSDEVTRRTQEDAALMARLDEYAQRRSAAPQTADGQWKLALWCADQGLKEQARSHLAAVVRLDPSRDEAWKRLGYKKRDGVWQTDEQAAAQKAEREAQAKADKAWKPKLEAWKGWLKRSDAKRAEAERNLSSVTDPRAVPSIWRVFATGSDADQTRAVQLLGQIDSPAASQTLASLALSASSAQVRRQATESLRGRDPRPFLGSLVAMVRKPVKYEVRPPEQPGSAGELIVEGKTYKLDRKYTSSLPPFIPILPGDLVTTDADGLPVIIRRLPDLVWSFTNDFAPFPFRLNQGPTGWQVDWGLDQSGRQRAIGEVDRVLGPNGQHLGPLLTGAFFDPQNIPTSTDLAPGRAPGRVDFHSARYLTIPIGRIQLEAERASSQASGRLTTDAALLDRYNATVKEANEPILTVLQTLSGQDLKDDPDAWSRWWVDWQGYAQRADVTEEVPMVVEQVNVAAMPVPIGEFLAPTSVIFLSTSCFGAGTPVLTNLGPRPIETLSGGDLILTQDTDTGALSYQPILAVYHNKPDQTLRIHLDDGQTIVATPIHRFWKPGQGWVMARELKPGDALRTLGSSAKVTTVEPERVQPVFNLEVAHGHSFFVGSGVLAHDNSFIEPTPKPFDVPAELAATP